MIFWGTVVVVIGALLVLRKLVDLAGIDITIEIEVEELGGEEDEK